MHALIRTRIQPFSLSLNLSRPFPGRLLSNTGAPFRVVEARVLRDDSRRSSCGRMCPGADLSSLNTIFGAIRERRAGFRCLFLFVLVYSPRRRRTGEDGSSAQGTHGGLFEGGTQAFLPGSSSLLSLPRYLPWRPVDHRDTSNVAGTRSPRGGGEEERREGEKLRLKGVPLKSMKRSGCYVNGNRSIGRGQGRDSRADGFRERGGRRGS